MAKVLSIGSPARLLSKVLEHPSFSLAGYFASGLRTLTSIRTLRTCTVDRSLNQFKAALDDGSLSVPAERSKKRRRILENGVEPVHRATVAKLGRRSRGIACEDEGSAVRGSRKARGASSKKGNEEPVSMKLSRRSDKRKKDSKNSELGLAKLKRAESSSQASRRKISKTRKPSAAIIEEKKLSTTQIGTIYELHCLAFLRSHFSMDLQRVGGKGDSGVDLRGWWHLPPLGSECDSVGGRRRRIRVIAQCKAESKTMGPRVVRELEGTLGWDCIHPPAGTTPPSPGLRPYDLTTLRVSDVDPGTSLHAVSAEFPSPADTDNINRLSDSELPRIPAIAILLSTSGFTAAAITRAMSSPLPFFLLHIRQLFPLPLERNRGDSYDDLPPAECVSASWNPIAQAMLGAEIEIGWQRMTRRHDGNGPLESVPSGKPVMLWKGKRIGSWIPT